MPIEFRCSGCNKLLRVSDESAGKKSRCPECGTIQGIPVDGGQGGGFASQSPFASPTGTSYGGSSYPPQAASSAPSPSGVNPYADRPDQSASNPYLSPAPGYVPPSERFSAPLTEHLVRSKVEVPAVALIVVSVLSMLFAGLFVFVGITEMANDPDSAVMVILFVVCGVVKLITLIGAIQMRRLQSYPLAMTAAVLSVIPCMCGLLEVPFGIWAIVVLADNSVRRAFQS